MWEFRINVVPCGHRLTLEVLQAASSTQLLRRDYASTEDLLLDLTQAGARELVIERARISVGEGRTYSTFLPLKDENAAIRAFSRN